MNIYRTHYKREIQVWKINLEHTNALNRVLSKSEAYKAIQDITFNEFDYDRDGNIDKDQFEECLLSNNINLKQSDLDEIFTEMDRNSNGLIELKEFENYREDLQKNADNVGNDYIFFEWTGNEYTISESEQEMNNSQKIPLLGEDDRFKWMVYIPDIPKRKRRKFNDCHPGDTINGYWKNINHGEAKTVKNEYLNPYEQLSEEHLNKIFSVLNYYYRMKNEEKKDDSPLSKSNDVTYNISPSAIFDIKQEEKSNEIMATTISKQYKYELSWWNQKGRYEANAICVNNHTAHDRFQEDSKQYEMDLNKFEEELKEYEQDLKQFAETLKKLKISREYLKTMEINQENLNKLNLNEEDLKQLKIRNEALIKPLKPTKPVAIHDAICYMRFNASRSGLEWSM